MNSYRALPHHDAPAQTFNTLIEAETWLEQQGGGIVQKLVSVLLAFPIDRVITQPCWVDVRSTICKQLAFKN